LWRRSASPFLLATPNSDNCAQVAPSHFHVASGRWQSQAPPRSSRRFLPKDDQPLPPAPCLTIYQWIKSIRVPSQVFLDGLSNRKKPRKRRPQRSPRNHPARGGRFR
jgi:hypothetical protein